MSGPIFPALLGETYSELPQTLQDLHRGERSAEWEGNASVRGARNLVGRIVAGVFGFPAVDRQTTVHVSIEVTQGGETWTRSIGDKRFRSYLTLGTGSEAGLMCERFGVITVAMALIWNGEQLEFVPRRWRIGPVPLPTSLLPNGDSFEHDRDGSFAFDVRIEAPIIGLIAAYEGVLRPLTLAWPAADTSGKRTDSE